MENTDTNVSKNDNANVSIKCILLKPVLTSKNVNASAKNTSKDINNEKVRIFRQKEILIDCGTKKMLLLLSVLV